MASQVVSDVKCKNLMHCAASYGERGSQYCSLYHRIQPEQNLKEHQNNNMVRDKGAKRGKNRGRQQAEKLQRLGFSYLASSFLYFVIKVKAFYNGFLGSEEKMGIEASMNTEAYFSLPVLPN